jgi:hypothetical protein
MKPVFKGVAIALVHVAIVSSLGAKLLIDRARCPRVWAKTVSYDPDLPIRGRYLTAQLEVSYPEAGKDKEFYSATVHLGIADGKLTATHDPTSEVEVRRAWRPQGTLGPLVVAEPVAFFLPEHYDASRLSARDQEIWMEVTIPKQGPPRPLRIGIKKNGTLEPLVIR